MKKIKIFILILIIIICGTIYLYSLKSSPFNEIVLLNEEEITSIEVKHGDRRIILTDKNEIENIMDDFTKLELKKSETSEINDLYRIVIKVNDEQKYGLVLFDNDYINIFNYDKEPNAKNHLIAYKFTNDIDLDNLNNLFK